MARKTSHAAPKISLTKTTNLEDIDRSKTIEILDDISTLEPGKNAQIAAKKISEKYKKIREAKKEKSFCFLEKLLKYRLKKHLKVESKYLFLSLHLDPIFQN